MATCQNCGKAYDGAKNDDWILNSPYCTISCNWAHVALQNGLTIKSVVENGCEGIAAKMCRNLIDVWVFKRAMVRRAEVEVERLSA